MLTEIQTEIYGTGFLNIKVWDDEFSYVALKGSERLPIIQSLPIVLFEYLVDGFTQFTIEYQIQYGTHVIAEYDYTLFHLECQNFAQIRHDILAQVYKSAELFALAIGNRTLKIVTNITNKSNGKA